MDANLLEMRTREEGGRLPYDWIPPPCIGEPPKLVYPTHSRPYGLLNGICHTRSLQLAKYWISDVFRSAVPKVMIGGIVAVGFTQSFRLGMSMASLVAGYMWGRCRKTKMLSQRDLNEIHKKLRQNPLYESACRQIEASDDGAPTISVASLSVFTRGMDDKSNIKEASLAHFNADLNMILIWEGLSKKEAQESVLFESMNSLQSYRFKAVNAEMRKQTISKEAYTWMIERIEYDSMTLLWEILYYGEKKEVLDDLFAKYSWKSHWEEQNTSKGGLLHSNHVRSLYQSNKIFAETREREEWWEANALQYYKEHLDEDPSTNPHLNPVRLAGAQTIQNFLKGRRVHQNP